MPISVAVMVGPADLRVRRAQGLLTCVALRTGACLCLYDPESRVGGMAHVIHSEATEATSHRPGKYAHSALEALIEAMERTGAFRHRLSAVIVGGAEVSVHGDDEDKDPLVIDAGVCRAVQLELERSGIPLVAREVGGKADRSVVLDVADGSARVKSDQGDKLLCRIGDKTNQALIA